LKEDYLFVAQALTSQGYIAVLADYRRYPEVRFPLIIDDARRATEWVKQNIEKYAGNANSIFLMGHSAGAHLAALLTLDESYLSLQTRQAIRGFIGLAGPYDFLPLTKPYQYALFAPQESYPKSQPINFVDGTEPALLLLYGRDDSTVKPRNIINLAAKVQQLGGSVTTQYYDGIDHVGILAALSIPLRSRQSVLDDINQFIALQHVKNIHEVSQRDQGAVRE
jgi:acetyl esterase/lipase